MFQFLLLSASNNNKNSKDRKINRIYFSQRFNLFNYDEGGVIRCATFNESKT